MPKPFLWNVLPEDNTALEFYLYLVHGQLLGGVTEFSMSRSVCRRQSLVSIVGRVLHFRQVSVNCLQNAENAVKRSICENLLCHGLAVKWSV